MIDRIESQLDEWLRKISEDEKLLSQAEGRKEANMSRLSNEFNVESLSEANKLQAKINRDIRSKKDRAENQFSVLLKTYDK